MTVRELIDMLDEFPDGMLVGIANPGIDATVKDIENVSHEVLIDGEFSRSEFGGSDVEDMIILTPGTEIF
jgi:hypothetical protein